MRNLCMYNKEIPFFIYLYNKFDCTIIIHINIFIFITYNYFYFDHI